MERTLVFLKPDALKRRIAGEILSRFERKGFFMLALKLVKISETFARKHYAAHVDKDFYEPLIDYITSGPSIVMVLQGKNAVKVVRDMLGETFGGDSPPGTIRGDFALSNRYNLVHASDSTDVAEGEIELFFDAEELIAYKNEDIEVIYDVTDDEIV